MIKVLFIHHAKGWGGAPNSMIHLINKLDKSKFDVEVLLLADSIVSQKLTEYNIPFRVAKSRFFKKYYQYFCHTETNYVKMSQPLNLIKRCLSWILCRYYFAKKELTRFDYDIVHLNSSVLTDWLSPAKRKGKVIIHIREPLKKGKKDLLHYFFTTQMRKYADRIIAISRENAKRVNLPDKTKIIFNYSDIPQNHPPSGSYSSKKFLYLGGMAYIKGFYTLVDALDYIDSDVQIYFAGSYGSGQNINMNYKRFIKRFIGPLFPMREKAKRALDKMKMHPIAIELGMIHDVERYLNEVCCLISPFSSPHFARPVIEAHLHKKPAIVTDVEGMDEILTHNVNGLMVQKDNPIALANSINFMARNPAEAKKMGEYGYETAIHKFTPKNISKFEELYNELSS